MGTQTSFDLNEARRQWQQQLVAAGLTSGEIEELQNHVAEVSDDLRQRGLREEESFWVAARRLGPAPSLAAEFAAADPRRYWSERLFWAAALGLAIHFLMSLWDFALYLYDLGYWFYLLATGWWDRYLNGAWAHPPTGWPGQNGYPLTFMLWAQTLTNLSVLMLAILLFIRLRQGRTVGWLPRRLPSAGAIVRWLVGLTAGLALLQMTDYFIRFWPPISRPIQAAEWAVYIGSTMLSVLALPAILVTLLLACRPAPDSSFGSRVGQPAKV